MKLQILKQRDFVFVLVTVLMVTFGTQSISYAQEGNPTITASVEAPLTETTLSGSVVTLTLSGATFESSTFRVRDGVTVSGIDGVTIGTFDIDRISDTQVTVELTFNGNIDTDTPLVFTVGAGGIADYDGDALTAQLPVTAVAESLVATTETPLTEATLSGSVVTLTLSGRSFISSSYNIERALTIVGIEGVTVSSSWDVDRVNDMQVTVELTFAGNIDADATLTLTVGSDAIVGYNEAFTVQLPVTAVEELLVATAKENPNLNVVKLTLSGRQFAQRWSIKDTLTISSSDGGAVEILQAVLLSDTEMTVNLGFNGSFNNDVVTTFTLGADAISRYTGPALTTEVLVTPIAVSLTTSTETVLLEESIREGEVVLIESPLTEEFLFAIRLMLSGRQFADQWTIENVLTFSSPDGRIVGVSEGDTEVEINGEVINIDEISDLENLNDIGFVLIDDVERVSASEVLIYMTFFGDLSTDAILTLTVGTDAILGYNEDFTLEVPVTAIEETLTATTEFPLTEENIDGSTVRLSSERQFWLSLDLDDVEEGLLTISGIEGVTIEDISFPLPGWLASIRGPTIILGFDGDFDTDATLTISVKAGVVLGYPKGLTVELPVSATQQSDATVSVFPSPITLPGIGEKLTLNLDITNGKNVAGYQATVSFDHSSLRYVRSANGGYLSANGFLIEPIHYDIIRIEDTYAADPNSLTIAGTTLAGASNGAGTLATLTFEVLDYKPSTVTLSEVYLADAVGKQWEVTTKNGEVIEPPRNIFGDLNIDGVVNIQDLIIIKDRFGQTGRNIADVNGDLLVDIVDLVLVAAAFEGGAAAPAFFPDSLDTLTAAEVKQWISHAQHLVRTDPKVQRGILFLEQLLIVLNPKETALLVNFPNPFNPETWIPYQIAKPADVTITIYAVDGQMIRQLTLGHQPAGMYQSRSRAAYWDGKNALGEKVTSGVYFYTLTTGSFIATRKMLIRK